MVATSKPWTAWLAMLLRSLEAICLQQDVNANMTPVFDDGLYLLTYLWTETRTKAMKRDSSARAPAALLGETGRRGGGGRRGSAPRASGGRSTEP